MPEQEPIKVLPYSETQEGLDYEFVEVAAKSLKEYREELAYNNLLTRIKNLKNTSTASQPTSSQNQLDPTTPNNK